MQGTTHIPSVTAQLLLIEFHKIMYSRPGSFFIYTSLKCRSQIPISRPSIHLGSLRVCKLINAAICYSFFGLYQQGACVSSLSGKLFRWRWFMLTSSAGHSQGFYQIRAGRSEMWQCLSQYMWNMHKSQDEIVVLNIPHSWFSQVTWAYFYFHLNHLKKTPLSLYSYQEEHILAKSKVFEPVKIVTNTMNKND